MVEKIYRTDGNGKRLPGRPRVVQTTDKSIVVTGNVSPRVVNDKKAYSERNVDIGSFSFTQEAENTVMDADSLEKIYKQNEIASACVDVTSYAVAGAGFHFQPYLTEDEITQNHRVILQRFFDDINEDDESDDLLVETSMDLLTFGDAYWERVVNYKLLPEFVKYLKNPKGDPWEVPIPYRFYKVSPKHMKPITNKGNTQVIGWAQRNSIGNVMARWDQFQILHFRLPSPIDQVNGVAPSSTLSNNIAADLFASDYNGKFFQNNATPRLHVDLGNVSKEEMEKFIGECETKLKGQPHKNLVTRGGVVVNPIAIKNADAEFQNYMEALGQKTMAKYRVPPMILGFLKSTSSMSAEAQIALFKFLAVSPVRKIIASRINKNIMRKLFPGVRSQFVWNPVDKLDLVIQSQVDESDVKSNIKTINEVRADRGMGRVDYGDAPIPMPGQDIPGGSPAAQPPGKKKPRGKNNGPTE